MAAHSNFHKKTNLQLKGKKYYQPLAVAIALALGSTVHAATFTVTNTNDSGAGSLRQSVLDANNATGADEIVFAPSLTGQTIILTGSELTSTDVLTIKGSITRDPNSININGGGNSRIISSNANLTLENLTLTGGVASSSGDVGGAIRVSGGDLVLNDSFITGNSSSGVGGGIGVDNSYFNGGITLNRTTVSNNTCSQSGGGLIVSSIFSSNVILNQSTISGNKSLDSSDGGGISLYGYFGVNLTVNDSTISNNSTNQGRGGGIFVESYHDAKVSINQSTISGNTAKDSFIGSPGGGGIAVFGYYSSLVTLNQSTIFNNSVTGINSKAGGVYVSGGGVQETRIVTLVNTILSGNSGGGGNIDVTPSSNTSNGIFATNSLFGDSATELSGNTANIFTNSPSIGLLKDNGGLTETHLPNTGSPALDKGDNSSTPSITDQRGTGFSRIQNSAVDIGSVERQAVNPTLARLTLVKILINDNGGDAVLNDFTLSASGLTPISGTGGSAAVTNVTVQTGTYALSETSLSGYIQTSITCTGAADTNPNDGLSISNGEDVTCTFVNDDQSARLTLIKTLINDNGGTATINDFTLTATGSTPISGISGSATVTNVAVNSGTYTITETSLTGYTQTSLTCSGGTDTDLSDGLDITIGESVTCTLINDDQFANLTLLNTVINDDLGNAVDTDWTIQALGPVTINGIENDPAITSVSVPVGTYVLSAMGPNGYQLNNWSCAGGQLTGNVLVLAVGENVVCTVTHDDVQAQAIPTLNLAGLLALIASFVGFFGLHRRRA